MRQLRKAFGTLRHAVFEDAHQLCTIKEAYMVANTGILDTSQEAIEASIIDLKDCFEDYKPEVVGVAYLISHDQRTMGWISVVYYGEEALI